MSELRRRSAQGPGELTEGDREATGPRYEFGCPRCAGRVRALSDAGAVLCPWCGAAYLSDPDRDTAWLLAPRISREDGRTAARTWLRSSGRRMRRLGDPIELLLPVFWARGRFLAWELADWAGPGDDVDPRSGRMRERIRELEKLWEPRFTVEAYSHTFPAHPLASLLPGRRTRLESSTLSVLDPDAIPPGYRLIDPLVSAEQGMAMRDAWLGRRERRSGGPAARRSCGVSFHLVAFPVVVVPFLDPAGTERAAGVDGLSGAVLGEVPLPAIPALHRLDEAEGPLRSFRPPALLDLECGECGSPLAPGDRDRLYGCGHCGSAWEYVGAGRRRVPQWTLPGRSTDRWLPFWIFGADGGGETPPRHGLYVPAYAARHPEDQLHLAARLTRRPPGEDWAEVGSEILGGATVGSVDATAWRWAVEGAISRATLRRFLQFLRAESGADSGPPRGVAWIPFRAEGGDLVEPRTGARTRALGAAPWSPVDRAA